MVLMDTFTRIWARHRQKCFHIPQGLSYLRRHTSSHKECREWGVITRSRHERKNWLLSSRSDQIKDLEQSRMHLARQARLCAQDLDKMVSAIHALGKIRVYLRCRPVSESEAASNGSTTVVNFDSASNGEVVIMDSKYRRRLYEFDRVFTPHDNQGDVFAQVSPVVTSVPRFKDKENVHMSCQKQLELGRAR